MDLSTEFYSGCQEKILDTHYILLYDGIGDEMEKIVEQAYLYDFYGELLTSHQQKVYEDFVLNDLSLSEIAQEQGISRQGVHDLIKRCNKTLEEYEDKLKLVEKFITTKERVSKIQQLANEFQDQNGKSKLIEEIENLSTEILKEL